MAVYCKVCGSEIPEDNQFCTSCGTPLDNGEQIVSQSEGVKVPKKKGKFFQKIAIGIILLVVIAGGTGMILWNTSYRKVIREYEKAMNELDSEKRAELALSSVNDMVAKGLWEESRVEIEILETKVMKGKHLSERLIEENYASYSLFPTEPQRACLVTCKFDRINETEDKYKEVTMDVLMLKFNGKWYWGEIIYNPEEM